MEKAQKGTVDWGHVAVAGALGAAGGGAGVLATRAATMGVGAAAASSSSRFLAAASVNAGVNGTFGAVGGGVSELMKNDWTIKNGWEFAGAVSGGFVAGTVGGIAGQSGGTIARSLGQSSSGLLAKSSTVVISAAGGAADSMTTDLVGGKGINLRGAVVSGVTGGAVSALPNFKPIDAFYTSHGVGMNNVDTLRQMAVSHTRSVEGVINMTQRNTSGLWKEAGAGTLVGFGADYLVDDLK